MSAKAPDRHAVMVRFTVDHYKEIVRAAREMDQRPGVYVKLAAIEKARAEARREV